jgi:hypothetical protein
VCVVGEGCACLPGCCVCMCVCMCMCLCLCMCVCVCVCVCMCAHLCECMRACMGACVCVCMSASVCVCVCVLALQTQPRLKDFTSSWNIPEYSVSNGLGISFPQYKGFPLTSSS